MSIEKILYQARAKATGGRDGRAVSSDGILDVKLTTPRELGGAGGAGTNPEQLFAAGYSACFIGAMKFVAARDKIALPADTSIEGSVGIGAIPNGFCRSRQPGRWSNCFAATSFRLSISRPCCATSFFSRLFSCSLLWGVRSGPRVV
jgi:hypothetical protein